MRKFKSLAAVLLAVLMLFGCAACKQKTTQQAAAPTEKTAATEEPSVTTEPVSEKAVFPQDVVILGASVGGMEPQQAMETVNAVIAAYSMEATVNGNKFMITAEDVGLHVTLEVITAYCQELAAGRVNATKPVAEYDGTLLRQKIAEGTNATVADATVSYSTSSQSFTIVKERSGIQVDTYAAEEILGPALASLEAAAIAQVEVLETEPTVKSDDPRLKSAAEKANAYLTISLTYTYEPEETAAKSQALTKNDIGGMIKFGADMEPYPDASAVSDYVTRMYKLYSVWGKFTTTTGVQLSIPGANAIQGLDKAAMEADLMSCLKNHISGTRQAPYLPRGTGSDYNFDGNYVEVNLTGQQLWVYKDGVCVVSTPIVSGSVVNNWETITGCYSIYAKTQNATLVGPGYATPVKYWMPFSGGYGLHDASWRSQFGGDLYLYSGSHGCVNLPTSVAGQVFENVSVGTPVILYGGATEAKREAQQFTGTLSYEKTPEDAPFMLDITALADPIFTYESDNTEVAEVSINGQVTIKGVGTAKITVTAPAHDRYNKGSVTVTVTVAYDCSGGHTLTWETKEPTCADGEKVGTCKCGYTEKEVLPAVKEHSYGQWQTTTEPGCTADGVQSSTCTGCGDVKTQAIPASGHTYTDGTCTGCGTVQPVEPANPEVSEDKEIPAS